MTRKLAAIWRLLTCRNYLLVIEKEAIGGSDVVFDFTMPKSDVKMSAAAIFDIIDEQDQLRYQQERTLHAFKQMLY